MRLWKIPARLLLPLAFWGCSLPGNPPLSSAPEGTFPPPSLRRPEPVACPPRVLRGLTLCLDPLPGPGEKRAQEAALYLARLLEKSGAQVALTRFTWAGPFPSPGEDLARALELARRAGAGILLRISGSTPPSPLPERSWTSREAGLVRAVRAEEALGGKRARILPLPLPGESPKGALWIVLPAGPPPPGAFRPHRPPAQALFRAVLAWWKSLGLPPPPPGRSSLPWPLSPPLPGPPSPAQARLLLQAWRRGKALDPTQGWLQVEVKHQDRKWILQGAAEFPALAGAAARLLEAAGFRPLENRIRLLPGPRTGTPPFGVVQVSRALTWAQPRPASGVSRADGPGQVEETEVLYGDPVRILDREGGFLLVHAASGYLGWLEEAAVRRCSRERFLALLAAPRALLLRSFPAGRIQVPSGASLPLRGKKAGAVLLETPAGGTLEVPLDRVALPDPSRGRKAAALALAALGTPYLFGGRDREEGIDCSGLVQACWAAQGIRLPRDARMQVLCGRLVGWAGQWKALRPGDLLFFMNRWGRISHVALSLGGSRFVHASPPEVTLGSLDPEDPWFTPTAKRFVLAKRIGL